MLRVVEGRRLRGMEERSTSLMLLVQKSWGEGGRFVRWRWSPFFFLDKAVTIGRIFGCVEEACLGMMVGFQVVEDVGGGVCSINTRSSKSVSSIQRGQYDAVIV